MFPPRTGAVRIRARPGWMEQRQSGAVTRLWAADQNLPRRGKIATFYFLTGPVKNPSQPASLWPATLLIHSMDKTLRVTLELSEETHFPGTRYSKSAASRCWQCHLTLPGTPFKVKQILGVFSIIETGRTSYMWYKARNGTTKIDFKRSRWK